MNGIVKGVIGAVAGAASLAVPIELGALDFVISAPETRACDSQALGAVATQNEVLATSCYEPKKDGETAGTIHNRDELEMAFLPISMLMGGVLGASVKVEYIKQTWRAAKQKLRVGK